MEPIQKEKLIGMLKRQTIAIAWKIVDIKQINPSCCTHIILMKYNYKLILQPQNMKEVVEAKVTKLLDVVMLYLISNSSWVI